MTDRVYVHIIEMTVFDEEANERPYVMLDRQVGSWGRLAQADD